MKTRVPRRDFQECGARVQAHRVPLAVDVAEFRRLHGNQLHHFLAMISMETPGLILPET